MYNALAAKLSVPVVKYVKEYDGEYPAIVYQEISNAPAFFSDNLEILRRITYQISIGTTDDNFYDLERAVEMAMSGLGFMRVESTEIFDKVYWREIKFSILLGVN